MAKILIVDDAKTEILIMQKALGSSGHTLLTANDGISALTMIKKEKPDLVLLDIVLPQLDGFQVCRRVKKDPEMSETPIILVSSKAQDSDKFWGMKQGANEYLVKPYEESRLTALVGEFV